MKNLKEYINVVISVQEEHFDSIFAMIMDFPFTGIEERLDEIVVSFLKEEWNQDTKERLLEIIHKFDPSAKILSEDNLFEKNWNEEWEKNIEAISVSNRIGIAPECKLGNLDNNIKIIINPKMSFGTGSHESTRLVCRLMEKYVEKGSSWIDAGTGSGALAILAAKLGASSVLAFDNNDWSIENAEENFTLNEVENVIALKKLDLEEELVLPPADGISANLFLNLVLPSFPIFYNSLKDNNGILIISGIMKYYENETVNKAFESGFELLDMIYENEWLGAAFRAR